GTRRLGKSRTGGPGAHERRAARTPPCRRFIRSHAEGGLPVRWTLSTVHGDRSAGDTSHRGLRQPLRTGSDRLSSAMLGAPAPESRALPARPSTTEAGGTGADATLDTHAPQET